MSGRSVVVAMSGGVDSSVAAALLTRQGMHVIGVTMQLHASVEREAEAAGEACRLLGADHRVIDVSRAFERDVIEHFAMEYENARTPNPCVRCNRLIKWQALVELAKQCGADSVATGHYAWISRADDDTVQLHRGVDRGKDQSYALWAVRLEHLVMTVLPLGDVTKQQTRSLAAELGLPAARAEESQDICFVPQDDYASFLDNWARAAGRSLQSLQPGPIRTAEGEQVGEHRGIARYTIGQRKGLGVALGRPQFVTRIDAPTRTIWIGDGQELTGRNLRAEGVNWLTDTPPEPGAPVTARIRYHHPGAHAHLMEATKDAFSLTFSEPQRAITPGQSAVLYDGTRVIGGGVIV